MTGDRFPQSIYFLSGFGAGVALGLLTASGRGKGYEVCLRGKEAKDVAKDATDVVTRGRRLTRPLSES